MATVGAMSVVEVNDLTKTYRVPVRESGLRASIKSLVRREYRDVEAVKQVSFTTATSRP